MFLIRMQRDYIDLHMQVNVSIKAKTKQILFSDAIFVVNLWV